MIEPKLAAPGSGLPVPMRWFAPFVVPFLANRTPQEVSSARYTALSKKIINEVSSLSVEQLNERKLVPPISGLEDSSRFWSVAMTLDHLLITGEGFKTAVIELTNGRVPPVEVRIENVKPPAKNHGVDVLKQFSDFSLSVIPLIESEVAKANPGWKSKVRLRHPWFGGMTAHQWFFLMAIHQNIHLKQIRALLK
jgi:hypothetical protein